MTKSSESQSSSTLELLDESATKWQFSIGIGLFLALFMMVFKPFGVTNYDPNFTVNLLFAGVMLGMGAVITLVMAANEFWLRPLLVREARLLTMLAWLAWVYLLVGSTAFLIYNALGSFHDFRFLSWIGFIRDVGMVISFPILGFWLQLRHRALHSRYLSLKASPPGPTGRRITFTSDNGKDPLSVAVDDVLFLESEDNYVTVNFLENGRHRSHLIRSTLKRLEDTLVEPNLARCHRSFIVNLGRVATCRGNRHGLHLKLEGMSGMVPVSRSYTETVLSILQASPAG